MMEAWVEVYAFVFGSLGVMALIKFGLMNLVEMSCRQKTKLETAQRPIAGKKLF